MTNEEINRTIGTRVAALRYARGLSAPDFAEKIGLSQWKVTRIEKGASEVTAAELVRIAEALGVNSAVLTGEEKFSGFMARIEEAQRAGAGAK